MKLSPGLIIRMWLIFLLGTVAFGAFSNLRLMGRPFYTPTPVNSPDQPLRFVIVSPQREHPFWQDVWRSASDTGKRLRVTVEYIGPRRASLEEQARLLQMVTAAQVDAIITQGVADERVAAAIARAIDRGIPVVTVGIDLPGRRLTYVGTDNYEAGKLAGTELVRRTGGRAKIGIIQGDLGPASEDPRLQGFQEALTGHPGITVVATESSGMNRTLALQQAWRILREHPDVTALYGTTALDMIGTAQAINSVEWRGRVTAVGWDVTEEIEEYMARGLISITVVQDPKAMGSQATEVLEAYLRRDIRPPKRIHTPFTLRQGGESP